MASPAVKALVFRIGALGDVLLTRRLTYSLFRAGFSSTLFAPARHALLLEADPWIDEVLDAESPRVAGAFASTWLARPGDFEAAVVISNAPELTASARIAARRVVQTQAIPVAHDSLISSQWAAAAARLARPVTDALPDLPTVAELALASDATLIHPGSGSPRKNWPLERFTQLARELRGLGHRVIWVRGPAETDLSLPDGVERLGGLPLTTLAATLAHARLFIGNDSGVSHLAGAVGAPTLALFGTTNDVVFRPDGRRVRVARSASNEMNDIKVEAVLAAAETLTRLRG